jgi:hypothetical protein
MSDAVTGTATPAAAPAPIVVNGGDGPVSFDELDAIESSTKRAAREAKKEVKDIVKETVKATEGKKDKDDDKSDDPEKEKTPGASKDKPLANKKDEKAKQLLKAKLADKDFELDADSLIPVKINGKDELISIKDLQSQYSGKVVYEKKFSEMDRERKSFETKFNQANDKIKAIFDEQDPESIKWLNCLNKILLRCDRSFLLIT